ncbi:MAG: tRNA uridine-5-carboxymethylaminomethyl(34) synthesis GTPase MnmE [Clostridia bacterium]|nr:tRNA uridine-5-carboxymethylaminomethyl(34) synthesis GTPase MnmE [Clostridia bacterium]MDD4686361.1 tRNA uridine-5-carboxymethylaminomethyl(34) synthesis GTPase MnmE [Clostridia bacterium]
MEKTIACISTPLGTGAISIIRVSGPQCLEIAKKVFFCKDKDNIVSRHMYLGDFIYKGIKDKCLMVYFKMPLSYTGEDMVEFQCHGGEFLAENILKSLLECGAELAENGEFSKRAFINGKLTLDKAEGIIDVINATSEAELKAGYKMLKGELKSKIVEIQGKLTDFLARIEVNIDYPEHDDEPATTSYVKAGLVEIEKQIENLLKTASTGKLIKHGINIAIIGKPNVGKSSLLNSLIGEERAIVTNIAGTTRDTIVETINFSGMKFNFIDTAGIRESEDVVEKIGIERSKQSIKEANLVLVILDNSSKLTAEDEKLLELTKNEKRILVLNKTDLGRTLKADKVIQELNEEAFEISALERSNIEELKQLIFDKVIDKKIDSSSLIITNIRHITNLKSALQAIGEVIEKCDSESMDIIAFLVKNVWDTLGKITGETEFETVIDEIFSKFCLGK